jgi:hypothetical protein
MYSHHHGKPSTSAAAAAEIAGEEVFSLLSSFVDDVVDVEVVSVVSFTSS